MLAYPCSSSHGHRTIHFLRPLPFPLSFSISSNSVRFASLLKRELFGNHTNIPSPIHGNPVQKIQLAPSRRGAPPSWKCVQAKFEIDLREIMHTRFKIASPFSPFTLMEGSVMNPDRPSLALEDTVHYFAFGSNMGMDKLRSRNGGIEIISYEPAYVENYRLAFNLLAFPPFEPTMASIEPEKESVIHGVLVKLDKSEYHKLYLDEGGGLAIKPYLEEVVTAKTYSNKEIQAIGFRTNRHSTFFLPRWLENPPSRRYLNLLINGATSSGVNDAYVDQLKRVPAAFEFKCPFVSSNN